MTQSEKRILRSLPRSTLLVLLVLLLAFFQIHGAHAQLSPTQEHGKSVEFVENILNSPASQNYCNPTGQIEDTCCDFQGIEDIERETFNKIQALVKTKFFRYYKLNLWRDCPFWSEDGLCMNRDCSVETVDESSLPEAWRQPALSAVQISPEGSNFRPYEECDYKDQDFCLIDDEFDADGIYVDLTENPERFTGYAGPSSARVWKAIYEENCFDIMDKMTEGCEACNKFGHPKPHSQEAKSEFVSVPGNTNQLHHLLEDMAEEQDEGNDEVCLEKRVYYRIVSGLHSSISIHICDEHFNRTTGTWGPNLDCFINRIGSHPERLQNIYFTYALVMRAVTKLYNYLEGYNFRTGDTKEDSETRTAVMDLIGGARSCPATFDEKAMFQGPNAKTLMVEFRDHFRNVSRIMDCVGCEKCRLWGKIQTAGLGTALKILFSYEGDDLDPKTNPDLLQRTELVALFNLLNRLTESLHAIERFRELYRERMLPVKAPETLTQRVMHIVILCVDHVESLLTRWNLPMPSIIHNVLKKLRTPTY